MIIFPSPAVGAGPVYAVLEDLLFGAVDDFGTQIMLFDDEGWYGSAAVRRDGRAARPNADGVFRSEGLSDGLPILLSGMGYATDMASGLRTVRALRATLATGDKSGALSWFDPDESVVLSALVERDGPWRISWKTDRAFEWQVALFAPDPRRYGIPQSVPTSLPGGGGGLAFPVGAAFDFGASGSTGRIVLTNDGTADTEPTFDVNGPFALGFQVSEVETGRRLRYESALAGTVTLDCQEGTATQDGQDRTGLLTVDEFFTIPPSSSRTYQLSTLGTETFTSPAGMTGNAAPAYH